MDNREKLEKQRQKAEKQHQEDVALTKVLYWFGGAVILETLLFLVKKYYIDFSTDDAGINLAYQIGISIKYVVPIGLILAAACFFCMCSRKKAGKRGIFFGGLALFFLALAVYSAVIWQFNPSGVGLLVYINPVIAVLALIYYLYQKEFFTVALSCAIGIIGIFVRFQGGNNTRTYVLMGLLTLVLVIIAVIAATAQKSNGTIKTKRKTIELFPANANYALLYITYALIAAVLVAALLFGTVVGAMIFYAVPVAWVLAMAVYYTVKLM